MLRWIADRRLVLAVGLAAALPLVVATVNVVVERWTPIGDDAFIMVRSYEVFTAHTPLIGLPSTGPTQALGERTHQLGPLLFWVLAVPARLPGLSAPAVTGGLIGIASIVGSVALARRRGGLPLMFTLAAAVPVVLASLPDEAFADAWNPSVAVMPFLLLVFAAWSVACGEFRLLPLTVLLASFVAQCHLIYIPAALGAVAVAVVGLALWARGRGEPSLRRWVAAAVAVALACWSFPVVDQLFHEPGNLSQLWRAARADDPSLGPSVGARAVIRTVGVPPWWLREQRGPLPRIADVDHTPGAFTVATAALVLLGLAAVGAIGLRRGRRDVASASALGLVLCAAVGVATAGVPQASFAALSYGLWWASPLGMWVWLVLGWSIATLATDARTRSSARRASRTVALAGLAATLAIGAVVAFAEDPLDEPFREMRTASDRVTAAIDPARPVRVDAAHAPGSGLTGSGFQLGLVYSLLRDGRTVSAPSLPDLGSRYGVRRPGEQVVRVDVDRAPPAQARQLARFSVRTDKTDNPFSTAPPQRVVTISVLPRAATP